MNPDFRSHVSFVFLPDAKQVVRNISSFFCTLYSGSTSSCFVHRSLVSQCFYDVAISRKMHVDLILPADETCNFVQSYIYIYLDTSTYTYNSSFKKTETTKITVARDSFPILAHFTPHHLKSPRACRLSRHSLFLNFVFI